MTNYYLSTLINNFCWSLHDVDHDQRTNHDFVLWPVWIYFYSNFVSDTQQADYHVVSTVQYRANGAVAQACLTQYTDLMSQYYLNLNNVLSQRCSAVNVDMNVSFVKAVPALIEDNLVKIDFILAIVPAIRQPQLYELCGSTLNLIFDLSVPYASAVIEPLLNVSSIGNQCPPLKALRSSISRGFTCSVGEVLNMDKKDVPRCCKLNLEKKFQNNNML